MSGHTHMHTYTHDNYSNPRCAHARRGLITLAAHACQGLRIKTSLPKYGPHASINMCTEGQLQVSHVDIHHCMH